MTDDQLQEDADMTLEAFCRLCDLPTATIITYVSEGLLEVEGGEATHWRFSETHLIHVKKACRLETDLGLNPAGSVLVLDLIKQIEDLKSRLERYERKHLS
jgi:chaperone modulatory protein CbpM